jgi:hypothetical protein
LVSVVESPGAERDDVNCVFFVVEPTAINSQSWLGAWTLGPFVRSWAGSARSPTDRVFWAEKIAGAISGKVVLSPRALPCVELPRSVLRAVLDRTGPRFGAKQRHGVAEFELAV